MLAEARATIGLGSPSASRSSSARRVGSASAANSGAAASALGMGLDVLDLLLPAARVHPQRLVAAFRGQSVEAALDDRQLRPFVRRLEPELDPGLRVAR